VWLGHMIISVLIFSRVYNLYRVESHTTLEVHEVSPGKHRYIKHVVLQATDL
jgi:hypothetical protein